MERLLFVVSLRLTRPVRVLWFGHVGPGRTGDEPCARPILRHAESLLPLPGLARGWRAMLLQGADKVRATPADTPADPPPAAPDGPAGIASRSEWVPDAITTAGGLLCAAVGLTVM